MIEPRTHVTYSKKAVVKGPNLSLSLILIMFLAATLGVVAQNGRFFTTDRELSNSLINKIYQDRKGFVWIATENGLNRFDGSRFTKYSHVESDSTSLCDDYVRTIFEDNHNRIWVGTLTGLMQYKRETDTFVRYELGESSSSLTYHVTSIIETPDNHIWVSTMGKGVYCSDSENISFKRAFTDEPESGVYINDMLLDSSYNLWMIAENEGLICYNVDNKRRVDYPFGKYFEGQDVVSFVEDKIGMIYAATLNGRIYSFDKKNNTFRRSVVTNSPQIIVKTLHVNNENRLFIGTDGQGLKYYNQEKLQVLNYEITTAPFDFSKGKVHSIIEDKDNNLWMGIFQKGVIFIPGNINKFDYIGYKSQVNNSIGSGCVMSILHDSNQMTWVGTDNDGLYCLNSGNEKVVHFNAGSDAGSISNTIMAMCEDSDNNLWIGSYLKGLARVDKRTGRCTYVPQFNNTKIYAIKEDKNSRLWVGTYGYGMYSYDRRSGAVEHFPAPAEFPDESMNVLCNSWVNCMLIDREGLIWTGTFTGVSCYSPKQKQFINDKSFYRLLQNHTIYSMIEDSNGVIWIGTSKGLVRYDKISDKVSTFTDNDGLANNIVCGIVEDEYNSLWISTFMGLSCFNTRDFRFSNYFSSDGLQGNEFSRGAFNKDNKGKIYFGGTNGITSFYSRNITNRKKTLKVMVSELSVGGRAVKVGDKSGGKDILTESIYDAGEISLAYEDNTFGLEFSVLDFNNPDRISYMYRLVENGDEWNVMSPGNNKVTFSELNPGNYTFQVRGQDHDNLSNIHSIAIRIRPHWTQSMWAFAVYILIFMVMLYGLYFYARMKYRHKRRSLERKHAEDINEAKLQFFINISHEIRTPMTLIMSPLEKLMKESVDDERKRTYTVMYRNAHRILRLINQLMDIRKLDKGQMALSYTNTDIVGFVNDIMQTFGYQSQKRNISFRFIHECDNLPVWIDMDNFDKVLINILSNSFKYTPDGGEICIELTHGSDANGNGPLSNYYELVISDTGIGIDEQLLEKIFERFYQVNSKSMNGNFGTGIGLHLAKSLVELQSGRILARNRAEEKGSQFVIRMPLGRDHIRDEQILVESTEFKKEANLLSSGILEQAMEVGRRVKSKTHDRVLVVEDEDDIRQYIKEELSPYFHILQARNGKEALKILLEEKVDLVISDVMMPEMDGYELCHKIKSNINIDHIPVIMLTAKSKEEDMVEGLSIGADAYLVKPFNAELLYIRVKNMLDNRRRLQPKFIDEQKKNEKIKKVELKSSDEVFIEKVMAVINANISDTSLNVEMLASDVGMSRVHMHRKLKELTNMSARDLIRNIRLKQAAEMLTEKKLGVSEVAFALGFSNLSHFSNTFRTFYGVSPKEYVFKNGRQDKGQTSDDDNQ